MKLIVAVVRPDKLQAIQAAIEKLDMCLMCISQAIGDGREPGYTQIYRGREVHVRRPRLRLEIAANDAAVAEAVAAIARAGAIGPSGTVGNPAVFVMPLLQST